jgi:ribosomal peptide maturation radical SAM protein 1
MRICLISMPWQAIDSPSLPVGLLHARLREARPGDEVAEYHAGVRWAEFLLERSGGEITPGDYVRVAEGGIFHGLGDWVFSGVLYADPDWETGRLKRYAERNGVEIGHVLRMRPYAEEFIERAAREVLALDVQLAGFTTTFMQNMPSLALAHRLKRLRPELITVFGGGNCDGPMGHALHRNHPFVDYVVRGEGELAFPALLDRISHGEPPADVPGVCWRRDGESIANTEPRHPIPPAVIPRPDFGDWQSELERSPVSEYVEPQLPLEGARGCWWGEKHQCTFCGLNGSFIEFRSHGADRLWSDMKALAARHRILDIIMVDNIIDMSYFRDFLPKVAEAGWDFRLHYEVKANIHPEHVSLLAEAGAVHVQPGIESLSSHVLKLMDKGATGAINVRLLRQCESHGITVDWNYLYGFPGETEDDYLSVISQFPAISHLQPPAATRITLERFSPYFERPELGFEQRKAAEFYRHVYALPAAELDDLVYMFDTPALGITGEVERRFRAAIAEWRASYPSSRLVAREDAPGELVIEDDRPGWPCRVHRMSGWRAAGYAALERGHTAEALNRELAAAGFDVTAAEAGRWLSGLTADGLVFVDRTPHGATYVAVATHGEPLKLAEGAAR